jgi:hypothetical protein
MDDSERHEIESTVKVVFWVCPDGHSEHSYKDQPRETVRWFDGVAHCMTPGCLRTSIGPRVRVYDQDGVPHDEELMTRSGRILTDADLDLFARENQRGSHE